MKRSTVTAEFKAAPPKVFSTVIDNDRAVIWRSDLEYVETTEASPHFTEHAKNGSVTHFTITHQQPCTLYAFTMEHKSFTGIWTGEFEALDNGGTRIVFTENIRMKNPLLRILAVFFLNLKKQQETYIRDLRRELGEA